MVQSPSIALSGIFLLLQFSPSVSWTAGEKPSSRRALFRDVLLSNAALLFVPSNARAAENELPLKFREFTRLAPLGPATQTFRKTTGLSLEVLARRLEHDLLEGSTGEGGYIISGDFSTDIFRDDCLFVDPTTSVASLSQCQKAVRLLFDTKQSHITIVDPLQVNADDRTISGKYRVRGFLKFPWKPFVSAYESNIVYKIDDDGLVYETDQSWTKSSTKALQESFTPTLFTPPPASTLAQPVSEAADVTALFDAVNGRRPQEYSQEERFEISTLIDRIVDQKYTWKPELLPGKWMLVYLQPGPDGGGIDRRIPFPDLGFNDNYQVFTNDSVTNIGQLFGPTLDVRVYGGLQEDDAVSTAVPKRFTAQIQGGQVCLNGREILPLPISGEGVFDGVYVGERVRIGQNLNGGGSRGVQVRMNELASEPL
jgi:hypothetical protein